MLLFGVPGFQSFIPYRIDLDVYRIGAKVLLDGGNLYGQLPQTEIGIGLPFTYPPIAAVLFVPLALMPAWLANLALSLSTVLCVWLVQHLVVRESLGRRAGLAPLVSLALLVGLALGPVRETIGYGQVNAVLMMLVAVGLIAGRGRKWRGWLVGLAMAAKLTPAVFLAYFLIRRDWRALGNAVLSALVFTGLGSLITPSASLQYWTSILFDPSRIGGLAYVSNQSINGALIRLTHGGQVTVLWFAVCAVIGIASLFAMHRLLKAGQLASAVLMMGLFALLASPVSWSHHWVWVAPALVVLVARWRSSGRARFIIVAVVGVVVFCSRLVWFMPHENDAELTWTWWQQILGNAQVLWGVAAVAVLSTLPSPLAPPARPACPGGCTRPGVLV